MHSDNQPNRCSSWIEVITRYPNIEIVVLNETLFFDDTPFQGIYEKHFKTKRNVSQSRRLSEYARLISSMNGGGTYMDLDFVLLKQLDHDSMGNFFAFEANASSRVANSVYHLNFGHQYLAEIVDFIAQSKDLRNISTAINHVMRKHCPEVNNSNVQSTECADLSIYSYDTFHPIASDNANINYIIFYDVTSKEQVRGINNSTVAVHIWDEESHSFPITYDSNYLIGALAKKNCPYTVELALKRSA